MSNVRSVPQSRVSRVRRRRTRAAIPAALGVIATGLALAPHASADDVHAQGPSRGFHVYNLSSKTAKVWSWTTADGKVLGEDWSGRPNQYSTMQTGDRLQDWELNFHLRANNADVQYRMFDGGQEAGSVDIHMKTNGANFPFPTCSVSGFDGQCAVSGGDILILDRPDTVHDVPAGGQGQWQADTLHRICADNVGADCYFSPSKEEFVTSSPHPVGQPIVNHTGKDMTTTVTKSDTVTDSNTLGLTMTYEQGFEGLIKTTIQASYQHTWTTSRTFQQDTTITARNGEKAWVEGVTPMIRDTGDATVKIGNTTWNFHNVSFDTPDPDPSKSGSYIGRCVLIDHPDTPCPAH